MANIKTYKDREPSGTFSHIELDDGNKVFVSLTQTEIAIFKVGFLGIPIKKLWSKNMYDYLDFVYPHGPSSENYKTQSVLHFTVDKVVGCNSLQEVLDTFQKL